MGKNVWIISKYATPNKYPRHFGIGKDLVAKGAHVTLITSVSNSVAPLDVPSFKGWLKREQHDGLSVIWMNGPSIGNAGLKRVFSWFWFEIKVLLTMAFAKERPDSIVSSSLSLLSVWSGVILSKLFKSKFLFEVRDIWPLSLIELGGYSESNLLIRFLRFTEKVGYSAASVIIGTMPNLREHVTRISPSNANKVICVPQGVYLEIFEDNSELLNDEYIRNYIPLDKFIVAYTGSLNPNNPIDTLLEVARRLDREHENIHFLILGEGRNKNQYMREVEDLSNVSFPPPISKAKMAHFLSFVEVGYDAFSSNLAKYGLSRNKWIDYMYNECIILCSYDGYQSMINEADAGRFVPFEDATALEQAVIELYNMVDDERKDMQNRAKRYIKNNRTFDKLGNIYIKYL